MIMTFHSVGNVIIPTDFHSIIFQRGFGRPKPVNGCPLGSPKNRMDVAVIRSPVTRPSPKSGTGAGCGVWSARRQVKKRFLRLGGIGTGRIMVSLADLWLWVKQYEDVDLFQDISNLWGLVICPDEILMKFDVATSDLFGMWLETVEPETTT